MQLFHIFIGLVGALVVLWFLFRFVFKTNQPYEPEEPKDTKEEAIEGIIQYDPHLRYTLESTVDAARALASELPHFAMHADRQLDVAEREFKEGAFAPFWDAIEEATKHLVGFYTNAKKIAEQQAIHDSAARDLQFCGDNPFQDIIDRMPCARWKADRLNSLVREAQKQFHFASIYEQRRTNQILVGGFSTLSQAISEVGSRLDSTLLQLQNRLTAQLRAVKSAQEATTLSISELHSEIKQNASRREQHETAALEMLDNIQRRRIPPPPKIGDRKY